MDTHARSIAKAVSYRVLGSGSTVGIFFLISGNIKLSLGAGALDTVVKLAIYFLHERLWNHIGFGRAKPPEYEI
jgi:adenylylsulfate kinase